MGSNRKSSIIVNNRAMPVSHSSATATIVRKYPNGHTRERSLFERALRTVSLSSATREDINVTGSPNKE